MARDWSARPIPRSLRAAPSSTPRPAAPSRHFKTCLNTLNAAAPGKLEASISSNGQIDPADRSDDPQRRNVFGQRSEQLARRRRLGPQYDRGRWRHHRQSAAGRAEQQPAAQFERRSRTGPIGHARPDRPQRQHRHGRFVRSSNAGRRDRRTSTTPASASKPQ